MTTKRQSDINGWVEIRDNPISKAGVFPYSGRAINKPGLDPDRMYNVYRPEEELNNEDTIESFKLLPFINEHPSGLLGSANDERPTVDGKPADGVIGEQVYFKDGYLYGNLKFFTDRIMQAINAGKKEISAGFRCMYEQSSGLFNGEPYEFIQRNIRGNHAALVTEGRVGPEVAVLDHLTLTFDSKELIKMADIENKEVTPAADVDAGGEMTLAEITKFIKTFGPQIQALHTALMGMGGTEAIVAPAGEVEDEAIVEEGAPATDEMTPAAMDALEARILKKLEAKFAPIGKAMDAKDVLATIAQRDALYAGVSKLLGAFDAKEMTAQDVAAYAVKNLGIQGVPAGSEIVAVNAYLAAKPSAPPVAIGLGMDGKQDGESVIAKHVKQA